MKVFESKNHKKCLDLGCGHGRNALAFARGGFDVVAVDISPAALKFLEKRAEAQNLDIHTICQDISVFPMEPESFDLILIVTVLGGMELDSINQLAAKVVSGLKKDGVLAVEEFSLNDPGAGGLGAQSEFAHLIDHYFTKAGMLTLFSDLQTLHLSETSVSDYTHGHYHRHGLIHYVGKKQ